MIVEFTKKKGRRTIFLWITLKIVATHTCVRGQLKNERYQTLQAMEKPDTFF